MLKRKREPSEELSEDAEPRSDPSVATSSCPVQTESSSKRRAGQTLKGRKGRKGHRPGRPESPALSLRSDVRCIHLRAAIVRVKASSDLAIRSATKGRLMILHSPQTRGGLEFNRHIGHLHSFFCFISLPTEDSRTPYRRVTKVGSCFQTKKKSSWVSMPREIKKPRERRGMSVLTMRIL